MPKMDAFAVAHSIAALDENSVRSASFRLIQVLFKCTNKFKFKKYFLPSVGLDLYLEPKYCCSKLKMSL